MPRRARVVDKDRGWKKFRARAAELRKGPGVTVGVHAQEGQRAHAEHSETVPEGTTVLDVAFWNEFGLGVPERSFIRAWFDSARPDNLALAQRMLIRVLKGQTPLAQALDQMGAKFVGEIQRRIAQGVPPPNAPMTIERKGSSKPLIDLGQMRQSLTWKAHKG